MPQEDATQPITGPGGAAFGVYPRQRARPSSPETRAGVRAAEDVLRTLLVPQDTTDVGLMLIGGPLGRIGRQLGVAAVLGGATTDAEAGPLSKLRKAADWVGETFYRGIPRLQGKNIESVSGLHLAERGKPIAASPFLKANTGNYAWAAQNPMAANSYTHMGGVVVPLEVSKPPGAILDAAGSNWGGYFFDPLPQWVDPKGKTANRLRKDFGEAFNDPSIGSVLVKNIRDIGLAAQGSDFLNMLSLREFGKSFDALRQVQRDQLLFDHKGLLSNNLLIKDPATVKYKLTGEPANFSRGGLAQMKACSCHG